MGSFRDVKPEDHTDWYNQSTITSVETSQKPIAVSLF